MEKTTHSAFSKLMSFVFIAMGIFLGIYAFSTNATTWTVGGMNWDNADYLSGSFRDENPTIGDIITALYGSGDDGSVYTENWSGYTSGSCLSGGMNVVYIPAGTSTIPLTLADSTIYVLTGDEYITTGEIQFGNCTSIVSQTGSTLFSTGQLTGLLNITSKSFGIIDNIQINGESDGNLGTHPNNSNAVRIEDSNNLTIQKSKFYRNGTVPLPPMACGIHAINSNYIHIINTEVYKDDDYGIYLGNSTNNIIENSYFYDNGADGIFLSGSDNNIFNNISLYNNDHYGISLTDNSEYNTLNNILIFNNAEIGLYIDSSAKNTINNIDSFNNGSRGIYVSSSNTIVLHNIEAYNNGAEGIFFHPDNSSGTYYGGLKTFGNVSNNFPSNITTGAYTSSLGWNTGTTLTGIISWSYITNPKNSSETNLLDWNNTFSSLRSNKVWNSISQPIKYSYGGNILKQTQPVIYSGTSLTTGGNFDATKYIGSDATPISGSLNINATEGVSTIGGIIYSWRYLNLLTIGSTNPTATNWKITGNVADETSGIGTDFGTFSLSTGEGLKSVILQLGTGTTRATHYALNVIFDTTDPTFTGTTLSGTNVITGGYYNTGITITFDDTNISGATLNGVAYTSGATITTGGIYVFVVSDLAGNSTGMTFTIDTISPTFSIYNDNDDDLTPYFSDGDFYYTDITIVGTDNTIFEKFELNGSFHTGSSLTVTGEDTWILTGYDIAGNTTGITFTIDKTSPIFTGTTLGSSVSGNVVSGGCYNTGVVITFYDDNLLFAQLYEIIGGDPIAIDDSFGTSLDPILTGGTYIFIVWDDIHNSTGMTFTIDTTNPVLTGNYPTSGLNYTGGNNIAFTRSGADTNMSGYTLYINSTGYDMGTATTYTTGLINGSYTRHVVGTDLAGNTGTSQIYPFVISTPFSGSIAMTGTTRIGSLEFTNSTVGIYMRANESVSYSISGGVSDAPVTGTINSQGGRLIHYPVLTGIDGLKDIYVTITNSSGEYISKSFTLYLDTQASVPTLITPASGATITTPLTLTWNAGPDNAGLSGYRYYVSTTNTFGTIIASGTTITPSVTLQSTQFSGPGTYYWYVVFVDKLGNLESSEIQTFMYSGSSVDTTPNSFTFTDITGTLPNRTYTSSTITIIGMTANTPVLASVSNGALYISGNFVGTTGYVQNGWTVNIELISSVDYEKTVSSTLTINGISDTFNITTKTNNGINDDIESTLSNTEKLMIISIFETLRDVYAGDKEVEFFNTFMVVLENRIDDYNTNNHEYEALTYLCNIIQTYYDREFSSNNIDGTRWIVNGIYIAPNGKKYPITYDSSKQRFTSSNFVVPKYFPTLDTLKYIIDINNPVGSSYSNSKSILARWKNASIDGTRQSSPYTAPNKKSFYFFKTITGKYSSYTFTSERYFDSLDATKEFIYNSNK